MSVEAEGSGTEGVGFCEVLRAKEERHFAYGTTPLTEENSYQDSSCVCPIANYCIPFFETVLERRVHRVRDTPGV